MLEDRSVPGSPCKESDDEDQLVPIRRLAEPLQFLGHEFPQYVLKYESDLQSVEGHGFIAGAEGTVELRKTPELGKVILKYLNHFREDVAAKLRGLVTHSIMYTNHPYIVHVYGFTFTRTNHNEPSGILMEYMAGGRLHTYLSDGIHSEFSIISWALQIARAVQYLHSKKVMHRGISLNNIFLDEQHKIAKLGDFIAAKHYRSDQEHHTRKPGTGIKLSYLAPEQLRSTATDDNEQTEYTNKVDIYALGLTIQGMYNTEHPFESDQSFNSEPELYDRLKRGMRPTYFREPHERVKSLIERMWDTNPLNRPSALQVVNELDEIIQLNEIQE